MKISGDADRYNHRDGNDDYVRQNNSYGLTTLKNRHATETLVLRVDPLPAPFGGGGGTYVVEPKTTMILKVEFDPKAKGQFGATVPFVTSDPALPSGTFSLRGKGK